MKLFSFFYNFLFIPIFLLFNKIISPFFPKLKERNNNIKKSLTSLEKLEHSKKTIWIHSASMGEFEQAKSIIETIKSKSPNTQIICTFFSPSGFLTQKEYKFADAISYLPLDTKKNASKFIELARPDIAIFIRYELWFNFLTELKSNNIKTFLINATFPSITKKIPILTKIYKHIFNLFTEIYAVSKEHFTTFSKLDLKTKIYLSNDTRFDRIMQKVNEARLLPVLPHDSFPTENIVLVAGSTWEADETILINAVNKVNATKNIINLVLVPHEPTEKHIAQLTKQLNNFVLLSDIELKIANKQPIILSNKVVVVDSIGKLLKLYGNADIAYIGGSFGAGVHSLTEAAGYGLPLCTGKNCMNSPDASGLIAVGALNRIENADDLIKWLEEIIANKKFRELSGNASKNYVEQKLGASNQIINALNLIN